MKLLKLVYFAHGWCLALTGKPLINEPVQAWKFGPVIPGLYHALKSYGNNPIRSFVTDDDSFWLPDGPRVCSIDDGPDKEENEFAKRLVQRIWQVYGGFTPIQLSNLTHQPGTPWYDTPKRDERRGVVIDQERIRAYFKAQAERNQQHAHA